MHPVWFSKEDKSPPTLIPLQNFLRGEKLYVFARWCRRSDQHSWIPDASSCRFQHQNSHFLFTTASSLHIKAYSSDLRNNAVITEETPGESGNNTRPPVWFDLLIKPSVSNPHWHRREPIAAPADGPFSMHVYKMLQLNTLYTSCSVGG